MKFLKQFKIFVKNELNTYPGSQNINIIFDVYDICVDLRDRGFETTVTENGIDLINIFITHKNKKNYFHFNVDVKDVVLRIYQYMRELGWYSDIRINTGGGLSSKKLFIRPDEIIRTQDIVNVDDKWPMIFNLNMSFRKNY
jgi:hypothetical protein